MLVERVKLCDRVFKKCDALFNRDVCDGMLFSRK